ncbi:MAG: methyltransferase domain-containing protein [Flavobacteriaceae bacterium]|uniref:Methyltransferase domain-containing protein n=1 Tax=Flavobacterium kayseriense TaxID=2764714 RepID=A0ABR7J6D8_9FLAO|nr:methyltransferase domain-containing protein [Flavobacterium kayseriense]MBC5841096.1 methyltransferase domain-containing protein [Flavobacterium kayseriense]MBC5847624.1 methyltransferase domain-containing protein [Flavobacterium kayseriense]MBX9887657.1 methyltransferase domain-containing protein [Flavobacteriaceae bacterium]
MSTDQCCVVSCDRPLDLEYWDTQYQHNTTGWDLGQVSPPLKSYVDTVSDKNIAILIPGCGNTYEAEYLLEQGFTNVSVIDIAPTLVAGLQTKFGNNPNITIICGDFFEHKGQYDLIIEQTFFCALPPSLRQKYVWKMHQLLAKNGLLAGLLFNRTFEVSPPFGGSKEEYEKLFQQAFHLQQIEIATNSIAPRAGSELFIEFKKNSDLLVSLYEFEGITCNGCMNTVSTAFMNIEEVKNVSMSTDFSEVVLVSTSEIPLTQLQALVSYDEKYKIKKQ